METSLLIYDTRAYNAKLIGRKKLEEISSFLGEKIRESSFLSCHFRLSYALLSFALSRISFGFLLRCFLSSVHWDFSFALVFFLISSLLLALFFLTRFFLFFFQNYIQVCIHPRVSMDETHPCGVCPMPVWKITAAPRLSYRALMLLWGLMFLLLWVIYLILTNSPTARASPSPCAYKYIYRHIYLDTLFYIAVSFFTRIRPMLRYCRGRFCSLFLLWHL